jgi:hypothetical protein
MDTNSDKAELKMLAVRLPGDVVDAVKAYASSNKEGLHQIVTEFVQNGITRDIGRLNKSLASGNRFSKEEAFSKYRKAQERGEIIPWTEKKMLAVRISPELMGIFRDYSLKTKKNMSLLIEEFIYAGLAEKRGEVIDAQTLAFLTRKSASPFRARKTEKKAIQVGSQVLRLSDNPDYFS